jgi:hypothetical protein
MQFVACEAVSNFFRIVTVSIVALTNTAGQRSCNLWRWDCAQLLQPQVVVKKRTISRAVGGRLQRVLGGECG